MQHARTFLAAASFAAAILANGAQAQAPAATQITLDTFTPGITTMSFEQPAALRAVLRYPVAQCPATLAAPGATEGPVTFRVNGFSLEQRSLDPGFNRSCANGVYTVEAISEVLRLVGLGEFTIVAHFSGSVDLAPSQSAPLVVRILPSATLFNPEGAGQIGVSFRKFAFSWRCGAPGPEPRFTARSSLSLGVAQPGEVVRMPFGAIDYAFEGCVAETVLMLPPGAIAQDLVIEYPSAIPPGSTLWNYAVPAEGQAPRWTLVPSTINGSQLRFRLEGPEDRANQPGQVLRGTLALVMQHPVLPPIDHQGMWWGGPDENGWGLGIAQRGERLFMTLFIYESDRTPTWFVLSEGAWDPARSSFTGHVFRPSGTWFGDYNGSLFRPGAPAGIVTLQVEDGQRARLNYAINGQSGTKALRRFDVATPGPRSGLWWGGPQQNGWGISLQESGTGLFAAWYTYDSRGQVTWLVMPDGRPVQGGYSGAIYRAFGATWLGVPYVAASFSTVPVGQMRILFDGNDRGTLSFDVEGTVRTMPIERFALP